MTTLLLFLVAALLLLGASAMTNLTAATPRQYRGLDQRRIATYPAAGAIFAGAAVEEEGAGKMQNLTAAGTTFVGIALMSATAADDRIEVGTAGEFFLPINKGTALALTDLGATVYAGDGNDFNLTSTSRQAIGKLVEIPPAAVGVSTAIGCWVYVEGQGQRSI